jgi:hypothetical protein
LKVLNNNIMRYKIPQEQAEKLRDELLKEMMLNKQSQSQISPMNSLGQPISQLGSVGQSQPVARQINYDDIEDELSEAMDLAEAQAGVEIPKAMKDPIHSGLKERLTLGQIEYRLASPVRSINAQGSILAQRILLYGRWISIRALIGKKGQPQMSREEVENTDRETLNGWLELILQSPQERIDLIFKNDRGDDRTTIVLNTERDLLKEKIDNIRAGETTQQPAPMTPTEEELLKDGFKSPSSRSKRRKQRRGKTTPAEAPQS